MAIHEGNMDKPVSAQTKRQRKIKSASIIIVLLGSTFAAFFLLKQFIKPEFTRNQIKTGIVSKGLVYESIVASGLVETQYENIILSPATSKLKQICSGAGTKVIKGDTLLIIDEIPLSKKYEELKNQLKLKKNSAWQYSLNTQKQKLTLDHSLEVKKLQITNLETKLYEEQQLLAVGGTSKERIRKTEQELDLAKKELLLVEKENAIEFEKLKASQQALEVEINMAKQALEESWDKLQQSYVIAPISGIVVEVKGREGEMVSIGQALARISDLETFKLTGTIGDSFSDRIQSGGKILAINNDVELEGIIGNIRPIVEDGQVKFDVYLKQNNHPDLRPNQKMEVRVIVSEQANTLRLPDGPFYDGTKEFDVFVVESNQAIRKTIHAGISNFDFIQITNGLKEGQEIIISDVSKYSQYEQVDIVDNN